MQIVKAVDAADIVRAELQRLLPDVTCFCAPMPDHFDVPALMVASMGGIQAHEVGNSHGITVDAYHDTLAQAVDLAGIAAGIVAALPRDHGTIRQFYKSQNNMLPRDDAPDSRVPTLGHSYFTSTVELRGDIIEI